MTAGQGALPSGPTREEAQALAGLIALFLITAAWWALALWPTEGGGPAWLERTRYVCFGVSDSGLPDLGGWIGLVGGPLGMLLILTVGWRGGFSGLAARARRSPPLAAVLASIALGALILITGAGARIQGAREVASAGPPPPPRLESHPRLDRPAPPLALLGQHGERVDLRDLRGTPVLVTFAYAHCQTVCPVVVRDVLSAREALLETADEPVVLVVTLDPWRDTPSRLPAMAARWGFTQRGAWALGGGIEEVTAVLDAWEVARSRDLTSGEVVHPSLVYVVDREGRLAFASTGGKDTLVSLVRRL